MHTPHTSATMSVYFTLGCVYGTLCHMTCTVTPSSLQVVALPSAVEAGLSKCTTLQKLTVRWSPPSVTAAFLKAMTVIRSLEEITLRMCDYGMWCVCVCVCVCVCTSLNVSVVA